MVDRVFFGLLFFVPVSVVCHVFGAPDIIVFITAVCALIPLARYIGRSTESVALQSSHTVAGLMNATFGNLIELLISIFAIRHGLLEVVKASVVGSIIGNILLLIGLSMFFGGLKYHEQRFNQYSAGVSSTMLIICVMGLAIPSVYDKTSGGEYMPLLSGVVSGLLALLYVCGLLFSLITHRHLFDTSDELRAVREKPEWPLGKAMLILCGAAIFAGYEAELMVGRIEHATRVFHFTETFVGAVIVAIVTNIAEKTNAVLFARKNNVDLSIEIGASSAIQIALFVVPLLVFASFLIGRPFVLSFSTFQLIAMVFAVMIVNSLAPDGACNWLEGAQLIAVYLIIAATFFFIQ